MKSLILVFEGYEIFKNDDGFFEIGLRRPGVEGSLTGTSSKLLGALKFIILQEKWSKE